MKSELRPCNSGTQYRNRKVLALTGGGVQQLDVFMIRNSARRINFGTIKLQ